MTAVCGSEESQLPGEASANTRCCCHYCNCPLSSVTTVDNGLVAGSSDSSSSSSGSDSEEPPESQPAKVTVATAAVTPTSPAGSSGLITQEGVHIPFDVHHVESLAEQGTPLCPNPAGSGPETLETVVCVPVPVQVGPGPGTLFENMPQEALGEVVASCPMPGMVPGSQVIIIAGPGYDALTAEGIHLNVAAGSGTPSGGLGDEVPCSMMEGVAAYTQTEPEGSQPITMDPAAMAGIETKKGVGGHASLGGLGGMWEGEGKEWPHRGHLNGLSPCGHPPCVHPVEKEDLYVLKKEEKEQPVAPELAELAATVPASTEPEAEADGEELDGSDMSAIIYEIPKEPEKWVSGGRGRRRGQLAGCGSPDVMSPFPSRRRRSKRSRVMDADGLLEMFHCPYEGCSQVYVALSSFQVRPPPEWLGRACFFVQLPVGSGVGSVARGRPQQAPQACLLHAHSPQLISAASHIPCLSHRAPGVTSPPSLPTLQGTHPTASLCTPQVVAWSWPGGSPHTSALPAAQTSASAQATLSTQDAPEPTRKPTPVPQDWWGL